MAERWYNHAALKILAGGSILGYAATGLMIRQYNNYNESHAQTSGVLAEAAGNLKPDNSRQEILSAANTALLSNDDDSEIRDLLMEFSRRIEASSATTLSPLEKVETEGVATKVKERSHDLFQFGKTGALALALGAGASGTALLGINTMIAVELRQDEIRKRKRLATRQAS